MNEYIDRQAAIAHIKENQCKKCSDIGLCGKCAVLTAVKLFESIPAADVRPVVRGSWEGHGEPNKRGKYELWYYSCTCCGAAVIHQYNFCPYCGADMRGKS